jgi:hypothetical protein
MIASGGSVGTGNSIVANGSTLAVVTTQSCDVNDEVFLCYSADSDNNTDQDSSEVASISDTSGNTWSKQVERNNGGDGSITQIVGSVWKTRIVKGLSSGSTITINLTGSVHDARAATVWKFRTNVSSSLVLVESKTPVESNAADAPSMAISGLANIEHLYFRFCAEHLRAGVFTPTANFTAITQAVADTGGGGSSRQAKGEFRINTSTGETSDPSTEVAEGVHFFLAYQELLQSKKIIGNVLASSSDEDDGPFDDLDVLSWFRGMLPA